MEGSLSVLTEARVEIHTHSPTPLLAKKNSLFLVVKTYDAKVLSLKFYMNGNMNGGYCHLPVMQCSQTTSNDQPLEVAHLKLMPCYT